jgi:methionine aminopeptidase
VRRIAHRRNFNSYWRRKFLRKEEIRIYSAALSALMVLVCSIGLAPEWVPDADAVVKENLLIESARITDIGMLAARAALLRAYTENITEGEVARIAANAMTDDGSSPFVEAFGVIVASGEQSAIPHGDETDDDSNLILPGEVVVVDLGARYRGYCTDQTRTFFMGQPTKNQSKVYIIVLEAQLAAIGAVRAGVPARTVDAVARDIITGYGYGEYFTHGLGHGIGLYIHMPPTLSPSSNEVLIEGGDMAITIEPGIYLEGDFGVRIEDDVMVTRTGHEQITHNQKDIEWATLLPGGAANETMNLEQTQPETTGRGSGLIAAIIILAVIYFMYDKKRRKADLD